MRAKMTFGSWAIILIALLPACFHQKSVGNRISIAKGNISLVLPDSSLKSSKLQAWAPCCISCDYNEVSYLFHNLDTTIVASVSVTAFPDTLGRKWPWRSIVHEKEMRQEVSDKNRGLAIIEHFVADSSARTVEIDYHLPKRPEPGRFGQATYAVTLIFYGPQRRVKFFFQGKDETVVRQAIDITRASVRVDSAYLYAVVKPYPQREYRD